MADLTCRTSLINGGYFNIHTIKLPFQTYSRYNRLLNLVNFFSPLLLIESERQQ